MAHFHVAVMGLQRHAVEAAERLSEMGLETEVFEMARILIKDMPDEKYSSFIGEFDREDPECPLLSIDRFDDEEAARLATDWRAAA